MGAFSWIGDILNDVMGVTSSAKQQAKAQQGLQTNAQGYTTWQMQNAHQAEVEDLKKAGLNPVLSAGGDGADGTPSMGSASTGVASDPVSMITGIINTMNNSAKTNADISNETNRTISDINKNDAEIIKMAKENGYTDQKIQNAIKERDLIIAEANKAKSERELIKAQTKMKKWQSEHPMLINLWAPMATAVAGGIAGGVSGGLMGGLMGGINSAKAHNYKMAEKSLQLNSGGIDPKSLGIGI